MKETIYKTPTVDFVFMDGSQDVILVSTDGDNFVSPGENWGGNNI